MSFTYLQGQEEEFSEVYCWDTDPCALLRSIPIAEKSCYNDSETECYLDFQSGTMCEHSTESPGRGKSMLCVEDFPVKTLASRAKVTESPAREADFGLKCSESFAKYDQKSSSWKTPQLSLFEGLELYSGTWPRSGTMRNGMCSARITLAPRTNVTGSGFLPTPDASEGMRGPSKNYDPKSKKQGDRTLTSFARAFPTPTVKGNYNKAEYSNKSGDGLATFVKKWPTPKAHDARDSGKSPSEGQRNSPSLAYKAGGQLNPNWVEWLMGWPIGLTDLKPLEMDRFQQWLEAHSRRSMKTYCR